MSYSWFRVDNSIDNNPKVLAFEAGIGDPNGLAYVTRLHCWTHRFATTGRFSRTLSGQVEAHCKWRGEPGKLISAFIKFGLIDAERRTLEVHDWPEFQGKLVEKSNRDAEKKRDERAARRALADETARAGRAPGAPTAPPPVLQDVTGRDVTDDLSTNPKPSPGSDPPAPSPIGIETRWDHAAVRLATWMRAQRSLSGNRGPNREADLANLEAWCLAWCLKYEPDAVSLEQMYRAFNHYLADPWAIERDCSLSVWCAENVGLYRWDAERARDREAA